MSDFFKFPTGDTKIRILSDFTESYSLYEGVYPASKYVKMLPHFEEAKPGFSIKTAAWAWAIVRGTTDTLQIVKFPFSLKKALDSLKSDPDWEFKSYPMPYDLTVGNTGEGGSRYSLRGSPKKTEVPKNVLDEFASKRTCRQIIDSILKKQGVKIPDQTPAITPENYPDENIKPEDIPFR